MSELKKLNEKLFYLFSGGLIVEILAKESLKKAFLFSAIFGGVLLILFLICKLADVWEWVETMKDWIEEIIGIVEDFIEDVIDWFKEVLGR